MEKGPSHLLTNDEGKILKKSIGTRDNSTGEAEQFAKFITVNGVNYLLFSTVFVRKGLGRILLMTSLS